MPLGLDSIVQFKAGGHIGTGNATLDTATTAGNHIIICANQEGNGSSGNHLTKPSGFEFGTPDIGAAIEYATPYLWYKATAGGETSWSLSFDSGGPAQIAWVVYEVAGLDQGVPVHVANAINPFDDLGGTVTTRSTGTITTMSSYDCLGFALFACTDITNVVTTWSGHTNNWVEHTESSMGGGASVGLSLSVAIKPMNTLASQECTASLSSSVHARACMVVFTAQSAKWAVTADVMTGFEFGTATNITSTSPVAGIVGRGAPVDAIVGTPAIVTSTPRTGTYCLELASSAAAECVTFVNTGTAPLVGLMGLYGPWGLGTSATTWKGPLVARFAVYFPTSLPAADTEIASIEGGSLANGGVSGSVTRLRSLGLSWERVPRSFPTP